MSRQAVLNILSSGKERITSDDADGQPPMREELRCMPCAGEWLSWWPHIRRTIHALTCPGAEAVESCARLALLQSAHTETLPGLDVVEHCETLCSTAIPKHDFPAMVTSRCQSECPRPGCGGRLCGAQRASGSHRTGKPRQGWYVPLITSSGFKTCWLAPRDCCTCGARTFPYFWSLSGEPQHQLPSGSWQYSLDKAGLPQLLVVRHRQAVETEYMKAIDIRLRHCPFTWAKVAQEYSELHAGCHGRVATLARDLRSGWQLKIVLLWRELCRNRGIAIPGVIDVKPVSRRGREGDRTRDCAGGTLSLAHFESSTLLQTVCVACVFWASQDYLPEQELCRVRVHGVDRRWPKKLQKFVHLLRERIH